MTKVIVYLTPEGEPRTLAPAFGARDRLRVLVQPEESECVLVPAVVQEIAVPAVTKRRLVPAVTKLTPLPATTDQDGIEVEPAREIIEQIEPARFVDEIVEPARTKTVEVEPARMESVVTRAASYREETDTEVAMRVAEGCLHHGAVFAVVDRSSLPASDAEAQEWIVAKLAGGG